MREITIRNLIGQSVKLLKINGMVKTLDISYVESRYYYVPVKFSNGVITTQKLLIL